MRCVVLALVLLAGCGSIQKEEMEGSDGAGEAQIALDRAEQDFGMVAVGQVSSAFAFELRNDGDVDTGTLDIGVDSDFEVDSDCPDALAGGESCTVTVEFRPTRVGSGAGTLSVSATPGGEATASLSGTALGDECASFEIPTVTTEGATSFCPGGSVTLTASEASTYRWSNGETTRSIEVSDQGSYTVTTDDCFTSEATEVTVQPVPEVDTSFDFSGEIATYQVPECVTSLVVEAHGSQGAGVAGGMGARMSGTFAVTPGETLNLVVGGRLSGSPECLNGAVDGGGGGGASFVFRTGDVDPMLAAGGGGAGGNPAPGLITCSAEVAAGRPGVTSINGTAGNCCSGNCSDNAGAGGGGGGAGANQFGPSEGGGGGWIGAGGSGQNHGGGQGPPTFAGGTPDSEQELSQGGFGAGGAGNCGGGGGGGYSGGGGGFILFSTSTDPFTAQFGGGGGGGSFNAGMDQSNAPGNRAGNGLIRVRTP